MLKGKPALVDSNSPRYGEKASYYSAVCLETGEVEWMELEGNSNSGTSVAFLTQLKEKHPGPLRVIWDNAPAHRGEAVREYLRTPELELRLVNLPGYSPDFNADEAIWGWAREEATGNLCLGSRAAVQERVGKFLAGLSSRKDEVRRRCRTVLQSRAETLPRDGTPAPIGDPAGLGKWHRSRTGKLSCGCSGCPGPLARTGTCWIGLIHQPAHLNCYEKPAWCAAP